MSAPHIYGTVVDALELSEGLSFLNIGAGTGFLSTVVAYITGPAGLNHGIEIHADVVAHARERCDAFREQYEAATDAGADAPPPPPLAADADDDECAMAVAADDDDDDDELDAVLDAVLERGRVDGGTASREERARRGHSRGARAVSRGEGRVSRARVRRGGRGGGRVEGEREERVRGIASSVRGGVSEIVGGAL